MCGYGSQCPFLCKRNFCKPISRVTGSCTWLCFNSWRMTQLSYIEYWFKYLSLSCTSMYHLQNQCHPDSQPSPVNSKDAKKSKQWLLWETEIVSETSKDILVLKTRIRHVEQGFWVGKYLGYWCICYICFLRRNENILPTKGTSELYEFIHRKGFIDVAISQRATNMKAFGLAWPAPGSSSHIFCVGIWWHCFATAALQFNSVPASYYQCANRGWKK